MLLIDCFCFLKIQLQGELTQEYTNLASDLLKWIKTKLDFLNSEMKFKNLKDIEMYDNVLYVIRHDEMKEYLNVLHRMRSIDAEYETLQLNESLQPDMESINLAWNKFELTLERVENDFKRFRQQYERNRVHFENDLDLIERDIATIERVVQIKVISNKQSCCCCFFSNFFLFLKSKQIDHVSTINQLNQIQMTLDEMLTDCQNLSLPYEQVHSALERLEQLNQRADQLYLQFNSNSSKRQVGYANQFIYI